ncbi:LOW QUALITY PROTEIN: hypothetical protein MXB_2676 [Myxobolus squamalis]|nr:LOW QUALITY PROTEIN: hypothetical protein MXB_2676 [Myxobolus squamalis]
MCILRNFLCKKRIIENIPFKKEKIKNVTNCLWCLLFYTFSTFCNTYFIQFVKESRAFVSQYLFFKYLAFQKSDFPMPISLWLLLLTQIAYYIHLFYYSIFIDTFKADTLLMTFHHILTLFLQITSYEIGYVFLGILVEFLHDANDIILNTTKILYFAAPSDKDLKKILKLINLRLTKVLHESFVVLQKYNLSYTLPGLRLCSFKHPLYHSDYCISDYSWTDERALDSNDSRGNHCILTKTPINPRTSDKRVSKNSKFE